MSCRSRDSQCRLSSGSGSCGASSAPGASEEPVRSGLIPSGRLRKTRHKLAAKDIFSRAISGGTVGCMSTALFLADNEPASRGYLERNLRDDGFEIVADPLRRPDLVIADDGSDFERWCGEAPVIVLGRSEADAFERVRAFRRGCDDYVPRPFHYDELVERIRAVLRRVRPAEDVVVEAGSLRIDARTRGVTACGKRVRVAQKEYELLLKLAS